MKFDKFFPENIFNLFSSNNSNRNLYFETLIVLREELSYYLLTKEECVNIIVNHFQTKLREFKEEDDELFQENNKIIDLEIANARNIINRLIKYEWIAEEEDLKELKTYLYFPNHSTQVINAFKEVIDPSTQETERHIYSILSNINMLLSEDMEVEGKYVCLLNVEQSTLLFNRSLQDMSYTIRKSFEKIFNAADVNELIGEHFVDYCNNFIDRNYQKLKTTENLYKYRIQILKKISSLYENEQIQEDMAKLILEKNDFENINEANDFIFNKISRIKNIFESIEDKIINVDRKHSRYIKTTISKYDYLKNQDKTYLGNLVSVLGKLSESEDNKVEDLIQSKINLINTTIIKDESIFKSNTRKKNFENDLLTIDIEDTQIEEIEHKINTIKTLNEQKYSTKHIEEFIDKYKNRTSNEVNEHQYFYDLLMAFNYAKNNKKYEVVETEKEINNDLFKLPYFEIKEKNKKEKEENE